VCLHYKEAGAVSGFGDVRNKWGESRAKLLSPNFNWRIILDDVDLDLDMDDVDESSIEDEDEEAQILEEARDNKIDTIVHMSSEELHKKIRCSDNKTIVKIREI